MKSFSPAWRDNESHGKLQNGGEEREAIEAWAFEHDLRGPSVVVAGRVLY